MTNTSQTFSLICKHSQQRQLTLPLYTNIFIYKFMFSIKFKYYINLFSSLSFSIQLYLEKSIEYFDIFVIYAKYQ